MEPSTSVEETVTQAVVDWCAVSNQVSVFLPVEPSTSVEETVTQAVVDWCVVSNQVSVFLPVEPSTSVEETVTQAVVAPSIQETVHAVQPAQQQQQQHVQASMPSTSGMAASVAGPSTSGEQPPLHLGKRGRDDMET